MATVNDVSSALMNTMNGSSSTTTKTSTQAAQDQFMTLLVTQMKNQDPLNPLDNAQVTSQLAQLSTVTGIDKLNTSITSLMGSYQTSQSLDMIGKSVLTTGNTINLASSQGIYGVQLASDADDVSVTIKNASGATVRTIDLGAQKAGSSPFLWDGKNNNSVAQADGAYTFTINATTGGKAVTDAVALSYDTVASVSTNASGTKLNLSNNGSVSLSDIQEVL